jgi:hypothetical protein
MKAITKLKGVFLISLLAMACATTPLKVPEKYNFDNKLQAATDVSSFRIDSWEVIDYQSLIIKADINDYYLLILNREAFTLPFSENIGITLTADKVKSGFDQIIVADSSGTESYFIHKMYKLKDREQATEIKKQIRSRKEADK